MRVWKWIFDKICVYLSKESKHKTSRNFLCDFDKITHEVRLADVLLIEGHRRISDLIKRVTFSPWTHAVLFIGRLHDIDDPLMREKVHHFFQGPATEQLVIETELGLGTVVRPLKVYKDEHIRICRPSALSHQDAQQIIAFAIKDLGKEYNVRQLFDLGRFLLASRFLPRKWKSTLFQKTDSQTAHEICSSMIASAFHSINFPILPYIEENEKRKIAMIQRNPKLFVPSDFDYSPYFDIIKYPMFALKDKPTYRNLPWKTGMVSDDIGLRKIDLDSIEEKKEQD